MSKESKERTADLRKLGSHLKIWHHLWFAVVIVLLPLLTESTTRASRSSSTPCANSSVPVSTMSGEGIQVRLFGDLVPAVGCCAPC